MSADPADQIGQMRQAISWYEARLGTLETVNAGLWGIIRSHTALDDAQITLRLTGAGQDGHRMPSTSTSGPQDSRSVTGRTEAFSDHARIYTHLEES